MGLVIATLPCTKCGAVKPVDQFDRNRVAVYRNGRHQWCRACRRTNWRERYDRDGERMRESQRWRTLKYRFGITRAEYEAMVTARDGRCDICGQPDPDRQLCIDHDHSCCKSGAANDKTCGECIRGLLCNACNRMLGLAGDDPARLLAAVAYLRG